MDILKDLFDEKLIEIINIFLENPDKTFSLTDISNISKVNVATTFRIIRKLISKEFVIPVKIKKVSIYKLADNEKTKYLSKLLKSGTEPLQKFTEELSKNPKIKKIILESKNDDQAQLIVVTNSLLTEDIKKVCEQIKKEYNLNINFVEILENQYKGLKNFKFDLEKKIIWEKEESKNHENENSLPKKVLEEIYPLIYILETNGNFFTINKSAALRIGGEPEDFIGKNLKEVFPEDIAKKQMNDLKKVLETKKSLKTIDKIPLKFKNKIHVLETTLKTIKNDSVEVKYILGISNDITE
jgi:PAS domain S-box-containing protein